MARTIVKRGGGVVVASCLVCASLNNAVADTITVRICFTAATTVAQSIELVAIAIAVTDGDVRTSAIVDLAWTVAHAASVKRTHAVVHVVTEAIGIGVFYAVTTTHAQSIFLVAIAIAVTDGDVRTSAIVDLTRTVAHAASVKRTHAVVHVVTDAIGIGVFCAVTTTHAQVVKLIAVAVAVASGDVRTSAIVDLAWTVAHAASVKRTHAVIHVVTEAIGIGVFCAVTTTHAQASSWLPSQSQSPAGMSEHPHS